MKNVLLRASVLSSAAATLLLTFIGGAQAAETRATGTTTPDQVVAELAGSDATVGGLLKCWNHHGLGC
jgi:hypothetical protein